MPSKCRQPFTQLKVQMDGKVYACSQGQFIGNINNSSIEEIWNGKTILDLRRRLAEDNYDAMCANCPLFDNHDKTKYLKSSQDYANIKKIGEKYFLEAKELRNKRKSISHLDQINESKKGIKIIGWAVDAEKNKCIDNILMFINGNVTEIYTKLVDRDDVALALQNKMLTRSGFEIEHDFISIEKKIELVLISEDEIVGVLNVRN